METARIAAPRGNKLPELHRRGLNSISLPFFSSSLFRSRRGRCYSSFSACSRAIVKTATNWSDHSHCWLYGKHFILWRCVWDFSFLYNKIEIDLRTSEGLILSLENSCSSIFFVSNDIRSIRYSKDIYWNEKDEIISWYRFFRISLKT